MKKKWLAIGTVLLIVSILFTILLTKVDVKAIGPNSSTVGFSTINTRLTFNYNETVYKASKYLGYIALMIPCVYALIGLVQLIKGKKLSSVDKRLYKLAIFYALVLATYVLFEKVIINYRPVILDEGLEASYPSSHTLMSIFFTISAIIINKSMFKDKFNIINTCLFILGVSIVILRLVSGVHWFTDILGAVLIASTLLAYFKACIKE